MLPSFKNEALLTTALSHRSSLNESSSGTTSSESYERLEFLGDAVLELATTEFLFEEHPTEPEGVLTSYRSALVKTTTLANVSRELKLGEKMYMSKGEEATGGRENDGLLADVCESVIGAIYLDQGFDAVKKFLHKYLFPKFAEIKEKKLYKDSKSLLQEIVQAKGLLTPDYEVISEEGPDHNKVFTVQVLVDKKVMGEGTGKTKQLAQQEAAFQALEDFDKS
ncbi:MAG: ribonuclease III [Candidatus Pacebacteria bacterium]|jgi:ribonuclease III|nr:ribonuclease III [Candidatus Paceibacterota bacterium]MBT4652666.1 ribonuclease III [Candidatus Paceibacterota bacterium]MBT6755823.1 ribonuclease III [Candidatus Paceibacterota bacterium]MBT6921036.1 ribonuclease III [Candidatus Paceibacterota bacterium]